MIGREAPEQMGGLGVHGKVIVIEGLDGSGKATQAELLVSSLRKIYVDSCTGVRKVSFPDYESDSSVLVKMYLNGEFGSKPDDVNAYAASSFYAVDRYASFKKDWGSFYDSGGIVIADRYTTSNAIHQCSKLEPTQWDTYLNWLFEFEYGKLGIPAPDLVVYLRVAPEVSQRLLANRYHGEDKRDIHEKDKGYLVRSRMVADYCSEKMNWKVIECCENGSMRSIEDIHNDIESLFQLFS